MESKVMADLYGDKLRRILKGCPACYGRFAKHRIAPIAVTILAPGKEDRVTEFLKALKEHRWQSVLGFQEFDPGSDAAEAVAVQCESGAITIVTICSTAELWQPDSLINCDALSAEQSEELGSLIEPTKWCLLTDA